MLILDRFSVWRRDPTECCAHVLKAGGPFQGFRLFCFAHTPAWASKSGAKSLQVVILPSCVPDRVPAAPPEPRPLNLDFGQQGRRAEACGCGGGGEPQSRSLERWGLSRRTITMGEDASRSLGKGESSGSAGWRRWALAPRQTSAAGRAWTGSSAQKPRAKVSSLGDSGGGGECAQPS